jgi:hypothetical protein
MSKFVHQMLNRFADDLMEHRSDQIADLLSGDVAGVIAAEQITHVTVSPVEVEGDDLRAISALWQHGIAIKG